MEEKELRFGNYVLHEKYGLQQVDADWFYVIYTQSDISAYKPIPLDEEWLKRIGFEMQRKGKWYLSTESAFTESKITFLYLTGEVYVSVGEETLSLGSIPVHKLQNIYFTLTGREAI